MLESLLLKINPFKYYIYAVILLSAVYSGWYMHEVFYKAAETNTLEKTIKDLTKQSSSDRLAVKEHQDNETKLQQAYILLSQELQNAKGKLGKCKSNGTIVLTPRAIELYDNLLEGTMPKDTTGTTEGTTGSSEATEQEYTLDDLYANKKINDEICNSLRQQILDIIKWDATTFVK